MAISKRFNFIGFFLILLTCSIKCQNYNVKTAVFVSNSLANRFYDLYDVRTHPSKEDFIKSFVLSIYSFEINEFFKTLTGPTLNLRSNMIYFRILSIADESNIRDSSEFCAYQDNLKQYNAYKWNVAIYLIEMFQPFTDFHSIKSICDSACLVSKTSPLLSEMLFQSSNQVSPVKQVIFEMLQHFYFEKNLMAPPINKLILQTKYTFGASSVLSTFLTDFFNSNSCNSKFEDQAISVSNDYLERTKEEFCRFLAILRPDPTKSLNFNDINSFPCLLPIGHCYYDLLRPESMLLAYLPPGTECPLPSGGGQGKCLGSKCILPSDFNQYIKKITTTTESSTESSIAASSTTPIVTTESSTKIQSTASSSTTSTTPLFTTESSTAIQSSTASSSTPPLVTTESSTAIQSSSASSSTTSSTKIQSSSTTSSTNSFVTSESSSASSKASPNDNQTQSNSFVGSLGFWIIISLSILTLLMATIIITAIIFAKLAMNRTSPVNASERFQRHNFIYDSK